MRNSDFEEKTPPKHFSEKNKVENWNDLTGLKKHKLWVDEKYQDLDAILSDKRNKVSKNTGKHK